TTCTSATSATLVLQTPPEPVSMTYRRRSLASGLRKAQLLVQSTVACTLLRREADRKYFLLCQWHLQHKSRGVIYRVSSFDKRDYRPAYTSKTYVDGKNRSVGSPQHHQPSTPKGGAGQPAKLRVSGLHENRGVYSCWAIFRHAAPTSPATRRGRSLFHRAAVPGRKPVPPRPVGATGVVYRRADCFRGRRADPPRMKSCRS